MKTILFSKSFAAGALGMMLTFGSAAALYSCSDDEFQARVNIPEEKTLTTGLEAYEQVLDLNIESDSEWKIEFDDEGDNIAYTWPQSGRGNANVKLHVLPNMGEVERKGSMKIIFPGDPSKNKTISIVQKANTAGDDNLDRSLIGNQNYALGWGYNVSKGMTPAKCLSYRIIKPEYLKDDDSRVGPTADDGFSIKDDTYTGSTIAELKSDFEATAKFEGSGFGFSAELEATFNMNDFSNEQYEYALSYITIKSERNMINISPDELQEEDCLVPSAYKALNNVNGKYPTTDDGFYKLVSTYGTHVVTKASLGGRLKVSNKINTSKVTKEYDLHAYAKLSYSGFVDASASADETYKQSYEENKSACETSISGVGGSKELLQEIATTTGDDQKEAVRNWVKDVSSAGKGSYMGINDKDDLVGIWNFVEDSARSSLLQEYIESGRYLKTPQKEYDMGTIAHLSDVTELIGDMNSNLYKGTLVKKVTIGDNGNKTVALLCSEYIPEIDEKGRVAVFYPVINGVTKYNMGLFLGNSYYKPSRVVNYGGKMNIIPQSDKEPKSYEDVYFRGSNISIEEIDDETPQIKASTEDFTVPMWQRDQPYNYPLVKVRNNLWMRENYASSEVNGYPFNYKIHKAFPTFYYYNLSYTGTRETTGGWKLPKKDDIVLLMDLFSNYTKNFAAAAQWQGLLGTDFYQWGYYRNDYFQDDKCIYIPLYYNSAETEYISCLKIDKVKTSAEITRMPMGSRSSNFTNYYYPIYYVKPIE